MTLKDELKKRSVDLSEARKFNLPSTLQRLQSMNVPLNQDGSVTLYHGTTEDNARSIDKNGFKGMTWFAAPGDMNPDMYSQSGGRVFQVKINPADVKVGGTQGNHFLSLGELKPNDRGIYEATGNDLRMSHKNITEAL